MSTPTISEVENSTEPTKGSLLVIFMTVFIDLLGFGMVLPLLPIYSKQFGQDMQLSPGQEGLLIASVMSCFSLMQFLMAPVWGRLSDRVGRRPVLMIGLSASIIFYLLFAVATVTENVWLLIVSRLGAGLAGATISTAQAYIADTTSLQNRQKGMALIGAAFGVGFTFGPLIGYFAIPEPIPGVTRIALGPWPGYIAAGLSAIALSLAIFLLPESLRPGMRRAPRKLFNFAALQSALAIPSIGTILLSLFISIYGFAIFETTLSLILKSEEGAFKLDERQILKVFSYIGLVLVLAQGGLVRRMAGKVSEGRMAILGCLIEVIGMVTLGYSGHVNSIELLYVGLAVTIVGFAFINPALNSLLSRRSDPAKQGEIAGVGQSISSLARIVGPLTGIPLLKATRFANWLDVQVSMLPLLFVGTMMTLAAVLISRAAKRGHDFAIQP